MALTTYSELQASIADTLNRGDLTTAIPDFIRLAEQDFNLRMKHWRMESRTPITLAGRYTALPDDWLATKELTVSTSHGPYQLDMASTFDMNQRRYRGNDTSGTPTSFLHTAGSFEVYPTPDDSYTAELVYYQRIPALSDSNTTNWLLTYYPAAYLYSSLIHSAPYLKEDARLQTWAAMSEQAIQSVVGDNDAQWEMDGLRMRVKGLS